MGLSKEMFTQMQDEFIQIQNELENGEISRLDAFIEFRNAKTELEKILEFIKEFEHNNITEIALDASQYPDGYMGFRITEVNGRKSFDFKSIPSWQEAEKNKKQVEDKYKSAFEGVLKGTVQTVSEDNKTYWIDTDGEINPLPEMNIGKSYLKVEKAK